MLQYELDGRPRAVSVKRASCDAVLDSPGAQMYTLYYQKCQGRDSEQDRRGFKALRSLTHFTPACPLAMSKKLLRISQSVALDASGKSTRKLTRGKPHGYERSIHSKSSGVGTSEATLNDFRLVQGTPSLAPDMWNGLDRRIELRNVVAVCASQDDRERDAL